MTNTKGMSPGIFLCAAAFSGIIHGSSGLSAQKKILILNRDSSSHLAEQVSQSFDTISINASTPITHLENLDDDHKVILIDYIHADLDMEYCKRVLEKFTSVPVLVLTDSYALEDKLKAYELGCDDFLENSITADEACARINKSMFNRIASDQLANRLAEANSAAHIAMTDSSDLGANLQFLLAINDCDNLDQLGQQFFSSIERYNISCSLQMRSSECTKNMEPNGMAKDLESQLLSSLKDGNRFVDFGVRTIVNYGCVSLLIKNMPLDNAIKYGAIKDNVFSMIQGLHARVIALDDRRLIEEEKEALKKISQDVTSGIDLVKDSYHRVMRDIVAEVEKASGLIQDRVPHLALMEADEKFLEGVTSHCIEKTNGIFNTGLLVEECFAVLKEDLDDTLRKVGLEESRREALVIQQSKNKKTGGSMELF